MDVEWDQGQGLLVQVSLKLTLPLFPPARDTLKSMLNQFEFLKALGSH
jgi:hypothetical protein